MINHKKTVKCRSSVNEIRKLLFRMFNLLFVFDVRDKDCKVEGTLLDGNVK